MSNNGLLGAFHSIKNCGLNFNDSKVLQVIANIEANKTLIHRNRDILSTTTGDSLYKQQQQRKRPKTKGKKVIQWLCKRYKSTFLSQAMQNKQVHQGAYLLFELLKRVRKMRINIISERELPGNRAKGTTKVTENDDGTSELTGDVTLPY